MSNSSLADRDCAARAATRPTCINLRERFGRRYKIRFEESYYAERLEFRGEEAVWLMVIPCVGGEIYPHGGDTLAAYLRAGPRAERLKRLPCVRVKTVGDDGTTVLFDVAHLDQVAEIMQPRKRRTRQVSPEERQALMERLQKANLARGFAVQSDSERQESTSRPRADILGVPAVLEETGSAESVGFVR